MNDVPAWSPSDAIPIRSITPVAPGDQLAGLTFSHVPECHGSPIDVVPQSAGRRRTSRRPSSPIRLGMPGERDQYEPATSDESGTW